MADQTLLPLTREDELPHELNMLKVYCGDVYVGDPQREPDGSTVYVMRPTPRLWGKDMRPGDVLIIDCARTPQSGDWVHVGDGVLWGIPGIGGNRFKEYPCKEKVLGVIVAHFPAETSSRL